ncbi:hypothetical protein [Pseudodesulfovibrio sp.]|uniref:hypothetical protein n=1 Tax=unclassified Pseudodesulfovibrio TaxID=2661612 RepID=UPI003B00AAE7
MPDITTNYGILHCTRHMELTEDGSPLACTTAKASPLVTPVGELIPQFTTDDLRKKEVLPVTFRKDGTLRSLPLEKQTVVDTPAGPIPAEMITFHANGAVNRVFPLNGKLTGYWSQEDEKGFSKPVTLATPAGEITTHIINVCFYEDGTLRSVTLWPDESVMIATPVGGLKARMGISFAPDGRLRSMEPAEPCTVLTPAGEVTAYDPDAVGVNGDINSLRFHENGSVAHVVTTLTGIKAVDTDGTVTRYAPEFRDSLCGESDKEVVPMSISFDGKTASIQIKPKQPPVTIDMERSPLFAEPHLPGLSMGMPDLRCGV